MTTEREALKAALEALEHGSKVCNIEAVKARIRKALAEQKEIDPSAGTQVSKVWWDGDKLIAQPISEAELYKPDPVTEWIVCPNCKHKSPYSPIKAKTLAEDAERITKQTRAALEQMQPAQYSDIVSDGGLDPRNKFDRPAQQEPVAYIHRQGNHWEVSERFLNDDEKARGWTEEPLYTSQPQRKPLTDEQSRRIYNDATYAASLAVFMTRMDAEQPDADDKGVSGWLQEAEDRVKRRAIEAAHGIKEQT